MAKLNVNIGLSVNDKTGDTLRTAFDKINQNFTELYTLTGGTSTALIELAQDYAAPMFNHASHTNITAVYDDANNKILLTGVASAVWPVANTAGANGPTRIAIGNSAGDIAQGNATVAVGSYAGNDTQGGAAVAIGTYAGTTTQRNDAIAIGYLTGNDVQGTGAVSIGRQAGQTNQGAYSIAIGKLAGQTNQAANTIILNALNAPLNGVSAQTNSFYVNPIRTDATPGNILFYNTTTKEITYGAAGSVSSLVNGAKTVSLGTDSILTLPAPLAQLINASQLATDTAKIYRATNSTDLAAIATAWETWYSSEQMFRELVQADLVSSPNRPWANKPSWEAYPIIAAYMPTGSQLPIPSNLPPTAKAAHDNYLTYKQLVSSIDIVNGNKTISFNNAGLLSLPGKLEFKDTANAKIILKTIDPLGYVVEDPTLDKTWTFNANGSLTFPNATTQTTAWTGSVSSLVNGSHTLSLGSTGNTTFPTGLVLGAPRGPNTVNFTSAIDKEFQIETGTASYSKLWRFETNGNTTLPTGLTFRKNGTPYSTITADLDKVLQIETQTSGGVKQWSFGTTGALTLPEGAVINETASSPGLTRTKYSGTFVLDPTWFVTNAGNLIETTTINDTIIMHDYITGAFSFQYFGYFVPPTSANYTFRAHADETFIFWIGAKALSGYTYANKDMYGNYNGTFPEQQTQSFTIALTAGQFYPIRIQWANSGGVGELDVFTWANDVGQANTANFTGRIYTANTGTAKIAVNDNKSIILSTDNTTDNNWTFAPNGSLTLPIGVSIDSSVGPLYPKIIADSGKLFSVQGQGSTGSAALTWTVDPNAASQYAAVAVNRAGGDNLAKVVLQAQSNSGDAATVKLWKFDETGKLTFPDATVQTTAYQKVSLLANQDVEVTFGVIGIKIINDSGCYVQIRATSSLTAHYNNVYNSTGANGDDNGSLSLTTSFVNFPNVALTEIGSKVDALVKIDSLGVAYRIQILTGSGSAPWNSNLVVIERVL